MEKSSKSAQISALVAMLKNGEITKAEMFERLQRLQAGETVVALPSQAAAGPAQAARAAAPPPAPPAATAGTGYGAESAQVSAGVRSRRSRYA